MTFTLFRLLTTPRKKAFENIVEKEKLLVNSNFSFSSNVFYPMKTEMIILAKFNLSSANALNLVQLKNLSFGRVLPLWAGGCGFDPWLQQTKVYKTGSSGFAPWRSGLWEYHYD